MDFPYVGEQKIRWDLWGTAYTCLLCGSEFDFAPDENGRVRPPEKDARRVAAAYAQHRCPTQD